MAATPSAIATDRVEYRLAFASDIYLKSQGDAHCRASIHSRKVVRPFAFASRSAGIASSPVARPRTATVTRQEPSCRGVVMNMRTAFGVFNKRIRTASRRASRSESKCVPDSAPLLQLLLFDGSNRTDNWKLEMLVLSLASGVLYALGTLFTLAGVLAHRSTIQSGGGGL